MSDQSPQRTHVRFPLERETEILFGGHVARRRAEMQVSAEVLVQSSGRSEEWLLAIERGALTLTPEMVADVLTMMPADEQTDTLGAVLLKLQDYPLGNDARRIRDDLNLIGWANQAEEPAGSGPASILDGIRASDRFLLLGPLAVLAASCMLVSQTLRSALGSEASHVAGWFTRASLPVSVLTIIVLAIALPLTERLFNVLTSIFRFGERRSVAKGLCSKFGLNAGRAHFASALGAGSEAFASSTPPSCMNRGELTTRQPWRFADRAGELIPRCRNAAIQSAMRTDFSERISVVFAAGALIAGCALKVGLDRHVPSSGAVWLWAVLGVHVVMAVVSWFVATSAATDCEIFVREGIGLRHDAPLPSVDA